MKDILPIVCEEDIDKALLHDVLFIFKHSPHCPISLYAYAQVAAYIRKNETPVFMIDVVGKRKLSQQFASQFNIQHQSPQVIFFKDGLAVWDISHYQITRKELEKRIKS